MIHGRRKRRDPRHAAPRTGRPVASACEAVWRALVALPVVTASIFGSASAASHLVLPDGTGDYPTIQSAVVAAAEGDTILLGDGIFQGDGNRNLDLGGKQLVLRSQSGQAQGCVIDCQGSETTPRRGFHFHTGEGPATVIEAVTVRNGWGLDDPWGLSEAGAVLCEDASPTLRGCVFEWNRAYFGAAILLYGVSAPVIEDCTFTDNEADLDGAGINCRGTSAPVVRDCLFADNIAGSRGGAFLADDDCAPLVVDCTFVRNTADNGGGAVYACGMSDPIVRDCTLESNAAGQNAAGLSCGCHALVLVEATIIAFSTQGPAVDYFNDAEVTLVCCDIYGNAGGDWVGPIADQLGINGNFSEDPLFCDAPSGDLRLHGDSPCLPRNHPSAEDCGVIGAWPVGCPDTGVEEPRAGARGLCLDVVGPNPSARETRLRYMAPAPATAVTLSVHDAAGRLVRVLFRGCPGVGAHEMSWNGDDDKGRRSPAGIYYGRLASGARTITRPIVRLR